MRKTFLLSLCLLLGALFFTSMDAPTLSENTFVVNCDDADLERKAIKERDALLDLYDTWSNTKRSDITTVVGGYNVKTCAVAAAGKSSKTYGSTLCAEDLVVTKLGGNAADIRFTSAIRPRTKETIAPCPRCKGKFGSHQFL